MILKKSNDDPRGKYHILYSERKLQAICGRMCYGELKHVQLLRGHEVCKACIREYARDKKA